jgi:hypothetical protein
MEAKVYMNPIKKGVLKSLFLFSFLIIFSVAASAQAVITIDRAHILTEPTHIQKKILDNVPALYEITDLVNYPLAFEEDRQRPGFVYMTVYDFNTSDLIRKMDAIVDNPGMYYIAQDSTVIPPARVMAPDDRLEPVIQQ